MSTKITKASINFRIHIHLSLNDERFEEMMAMFRKYKGVTDEVTFFTSDTHSPMTLETAQARCKIIKQRMIDVRKLKLSTGIDVIPTLGSHEENLPYSLKEDFTPMTDIDGKTCRGSFCPNDPKMQKYIYELYRITADANPDYIWIDDDITFFIKMPIGAACFCDYCLSKFQKQTGTRWTRKSLQAAFDQKDKKAALDIRNAWIQHNRDSMNMTLGIIEKAVHKVKPDMPLGFMTDDVKSVYDGYDFDRWTKTLAGPKNAEVMWRPGGGFYTDLVLEQLIDKVHEMGRQASVLPESMKCIQSENENFPYQRMQKAENTLIVEAAAAQAAGCTGTAWSVLMMYDGGDFNEYEPLVAQLQKARPFYDLMARVFGREKPHGVHTGWNKNTFAPVNLSKGQWLKGDAWAMNHFAAQVFQTGIPAAYSTDAAPVMFMGGQNPEAMSDKEIKNAFSKGVVLDGPALETLNAMGYGKLTGFTVEKYLHDDCIEQFLDHPLNGRFAGKKRDGRQSFRWWTCPAAVLKPTDSKSQIISRLIDYEEKETAACTAGIFENDLGGRVFAAGYFPWTFIQNLSKTTQMKNITRWLSKDNLLGYVQSFHKINIWVRDHGKGKLSAALLNGSLDPGKNVELMLRTKKSQIITYDMSCRNVIIKSSGKDGAYTKFVLPKIAPWQMCLVIA